jgi:hypothetical protein
LIRELLLERKEVSDITTRIFPVASEEGDLPCVVYRRAALNRSPVKRPGEPGAESVEIEVVCYAATYGESVTLAEEVRAALDGKQKSAYGLNLRSCTLTDSSEGWADDAYAQQLTFNIKI